MTDAPRTRTMPTTFARLEAANKRLTEENKALREKSELLEDGMSPHLAEVAETDTHFILLGTPGSHNCDEMGCGSVGHHVLMRVHKSELPSVEALLEWSQEAYRWLGSYCSFSECYKNAPDSVKGGE